jgi:regulator of protease activity HflC (stomatin/prohibitin superfamily)
MSMPPPFALNADNSLERFLARFRLPAALVERLLHDATSNSHYRRLKSFDELDMVPANSTYGGNALGSLMCMTTVLISDDSIGCMTVGEVDVFLQCGYHKFCGCGRELQSIQKLNQPGKAVLNGTRGFVSVPEGQIGVLLVGAEYRLLAPGLYEWNSPLVQFRGNVSISGNFVNLGPYALLTVPDGQVAVTYNNGDLRILGLTGRDGGTSAAAGPRTYFLDDPRWIHHGFLSLQTQTDRLDGNDLLTKDHVEILMVAMSEWRIVDPTRAIMHCGSTMADIQAKVDALVRATIARIVAGTSIGSGPVSGHVATRGGGNVVVGQPVPAAAGEGKGSSASADDDSDMSQMMQTTAAVKHMAELTANMTAMGVEVLGVYVPEKQIKNTGIREQIANQAVIGIKAEAERAAADAAAYTITRKARADAEAIEVVARAHAEAGQMLGGVDSTAARLALTEKMVSVLDGANVTLMSGMPHNTPFLLTGPTTVGASM